MKCTIQEFPERKKSLPSTWIHVKYFSFDGPFLFLDQSMLHKEQEILDELCGKEDLENSSISCADESYAEKTGDNILSEDGVPVENGLTTAYEHDLLWGWKALQQLLMNLGSKMDTT